MQRAGSILMLMLLQLTWALAELHRAKYQRAFPRSPAAGGQDETVAADPLSTLRLWYDQHEPWVLAVLGATLVGFSGILPLLVIPLETGIKLKQRAGEKRLRLLLSFAVGGLIGDVFLHLVPEAMRHTHNDQEQIRVGLWIIAGVLFFTVLEMLFSQTERGAEGTSDSDADTAEIHAEAVTKLNGVIQNGSTADLKQRLRSKQSNGHVPAASVTANGHVTASSAAANGHVTGREQSTTPATTKDVSGYLNLLANSVDNFTHGLAIGGSFLACTKLGLLTTFAILIHEIPHEVGDFAILLKSGFSRWEAAKAQMATATLGITGAISALLADDPKSLGDRTAWILPFTAGGFIQIALVGVLPEVAKEREPLQCFKQVVCMVVGILIMLAVTVTFEH